MPEELARRLQSYRVRPDIAFLLDRARHGYLTIAIQGFEAQHRAHRDPPLPGYFLATLYARVPNGLGPAMETYATVLRADPGFANDPTLLHDVVHAFGVGQRRAESLVRGVLTNTARAELLALALRSTDGRARARARAALAAPPYASQLDDAERAQLGR